MATSTRLPSVLITSAGRRVARLRIFRESLARLDGGRVGAADCSRRSAAFQEADFACQVPRYGDATFVPRLLEICERENVRLLVPGIDPELTVLANRLEEFKKLGIQCLVADSQAIGMTYNKKRAADLFQSVGLRIPERYSVEMLRKNPASVIWPIVIKPTFGSASVGLTVVASAREAELSLESVKDPVIQRRIRGMEYTIDVLTDLDGRWREAVPRVRLEVRSGEISKGYTIRDKELIEHTKRICDAIPGLRGPLSIQCIRDEDNGREPYYVDINTRFGGGYPLCDRAGGRFAQWLLEWTLGKPSSFVAGAWKDGLAMLRYDDAVFVPKTALGE